MEAMPHMMTMYHGYALRQRLPGRALGRPGPESQNHFMLAMRGPWLGGKLSLPRYVYAGALTIPPGGVPSSSSAADPRWVLLIDRQHPHDFFVELAAAWERSVARDLKLRLYLARRSGAGLRASVRAPLSGVRKPDVSPGTTTRTRPTSPTT